MKKVYVLIIFQFLLIIGIVLHFNVTKISKNDIHLFGTYIEEYNDHIYVLAKDEYDARKNLTKSVMLVGIDYQNIVSGGGK